MDDAKLHAISSMLQIGSFGQPESWLLESEIKPLLKSDETSDSTQMFYYWLSKSWQCLRQGSLDKGFELLEKIKNQVTDSSTYENALLRLETKFLTSVYLSIPKWKVPARTKSIDCISEGVSVFRSIIEHTKNKRSDLKIHARLLSMLMRVAHWLVDIHFSLYWTVEVNQILRDLLVLVQIAGLSTRAAYIMTLMAESDVLRSSFANANVKMITLNSFYMSSMWSLHSPRDKLTVHKLCDKMNELSIASSQKSQKIIDFRLDNTTRNEIIASRKREDVESVSSSPVCKSHCTQGLKMCVPSWYCQCYSCKNVLSHCVVLHYTIVMALFNHFSGNSEAALKFFEDGLLMCNSLFNIHTHLISEMNRVISCTIQEDAVYSSLTSSLVEKMKVYVHHYAKFLSQHKKHDLAASLLQKVSHLEENEANKKSYCNLDFTEHQYALKLLFLDDDQQLDTTVYKPCKINAVPDTPSMKAQPLTDKLLMSTPKNAPPILQATPVLKYTSKKADTEFCGNIRRRCGRKGKNIFDEDERPDTLSSENAQQRNWKMKLDEYCEVLNVEKREVKNSDVPETLETKNGSVTECKTPFTKSRKQRAKPVNKTCRPTDQSDDPLVLSRRPKCRPRKRSSCSSDESDNYIPNIHKSPLKEHLVKNIDISNDMAKINMILPKLNSGQKLKTKSKNSVNISGVKNCEGTLVVGNCDMEPFTPETMKKSVKEFKTPLHVSQKPRSLIKASYNLTEDSIHIPRRSRTRQRNFSSVSSDDNNSCIPEFLLKSPSINTCSTERSVTNARKVVRRGTACQKSDRIKIFCDSSEGRDLDSVDNSSKSHKCNSRSKVKL